MRAETLISSAAVFLVWFLALSFHRASAPPSGQRDAVMFGTVADTGRTLSMRTDFASFYYACKAAQHGGNMYNARYLDSLAASDRVANHILPYLYPPFFALVAQSLGSLPPAEASSVWDTVQVVVFSGVAVCLFLILRAFSPERRDRVVAPAIVLGLLGILPFAVNIDFGQINGIVLLCITLSLLLFLVQKADWTAGVILSLAALIKVTPALLLVYCVVQKRWRVVAGFLAGLLVFVLATFDVGGKDHWREFLAFLPDMGYAKNVQGGFHPSIVANISLAGFFMRVFVGQVVLVRMLTMVTLVVMVAVLLYHHVKYANEKAAAGFILPYLVLMVIASPVAWLHHLVYLLPGIAFALYASYAEFEGRTRIAWIVTLGVTAFLASFDFQSVYPLWQLPWGARPYLTSMNLLFLLLLFALGLAQVRWRRSLLVTA